MDNQKQFSLDRFLSTIHQKITNRTVMVSRFHNHSNIKSKWLIFSEINKIPSEDLSESLLHDNIEEEMNKIPPKDLPESLLHDNIEEEMNKIPPKDLPESLLHDNIEEEENLEDLLVEIPNEYKPINRYI
ncbi:uncharacterized protein LOC126900970 isoform X8 [Daktulosphaira vitifoliae]|uniref:uncharacterized protein LOC126900970 isoform X8 n=1 Tax=Daktulosphaira vitifoliae TaxID=58002 RepID=UPI0021AA204E|nr:uncharacterized protein LOC126900970 isoform X8 [Daktulosphaira vitifoliae]